MKALTIFMGLMFFSVASSGAFFGKDDDPVKKAEKVAKEQQSILKMRDETLEELYVLNPETKDLVAKSKGVGKPALEKKRLCACFPPVAGWEWV